MLHAAQGVLFWHYPIIWYLENGGRLFWILFPPTSPFALGSHQQRTQGFFVSSWWKSLTISYHFSIILMLSTIFPLPLSSGLLGEEQWIGGFFVQFFLISPGPVLKYASPWEMPVSFNRCGHLQVGKRKSACSLPWKPVYQWRHWGHTPYLSSPWSSAKSVLISGASCFPSPSFSPEELPQPSSLENLQAPFVWLALPLPCGLEK